MLIPAATPEPAVNVSVLAVVEDAGLNDPVTPFGRPVTASFTAPVNSPDGVIAIPAELAPPVTTLRAEAEVFSENPLAAATTRLTVVPALMLPDEP